MLVTLKKDIVLFHGNITFKKNIPMKLIKYKGIEYVQHPTIEGRLTNVNKSQYC